MKQRHQRSFDICSPRFDSQGPLQYAADSGPSKGSRGIVVDLWSDVWESAWLQSALEGLWMLNTYLDDHGPGCFVQVGQNGRQGSLASANGRFPTPFVCSGPVQGTGVHPPNCRGCTRLPSRVCNSELVVAAGRVRGSSGSNSSVWRGFISSGIQQFVGSRSPAFLTPLPAHWCVCDFTLSGFAAYNADLLLNRSI